MIKDIASEKISQEKRTKTKEENEKKRVDVPLFVWTSEYMHTEICKIANFCDYRLSKH